MMLNTKVGVSSLAFFAVCGLSMAANNDHAAEAGMRKRAVQKKLRERKNNNAGNNNKRHLATAKRKNRKAKNDEDITEDVAFWTRMLQGSMPAPSPPSG